MNKNIKRALPILFGIIIIASMIWYLFVYDQDFTRDMLLQGARFFENRGDHAVAAWFYDQAYEQSNGDENVAIELAEHFKANGNYTQAEVTLSRAIAEGGSVQLYIALCKTYVEQDKLLDAVTMLDNIADKAIRQQISDLRPAAPTADIAPGFYSQYIPVQITPSTGSLYITTDGEYPSTAGGSSDGRLTLVGGENTIYALSVDSNGLVSPLAIFGYTISGVIEEITFSDQALDTAIRKALNFDSDDTIYSSNLWTIKELILPDGAGSYAELAYLPYLEKLTIGASTANSLEGLASLTSLTELTVTQATLRTSDLLIVASLPNLQRLTLSGCSLSSIDNLSGAKHLQYLDLSDNSIRDFSALSYMDNLTVLDLSHNALTSLNDASAMAGLTELDVSYNSLTSIVPISGCVALTKLDVSNNMITSLSGVEALTGLLELNASGNTVTSVTPLSSCTALTRLDISGNSLTDITCLSVLTKLQYFSFARNAVLFLPDWENDCALVTIDGSYNQITSVAPLSGCEKLNYVLLDYNTISSVDTLAKCPNLIKVSIYGNPVTDVSALTNPDGHEQSIIVIWNPLT